MFARGNWFSLARGGAAWASSDVKHVIVTNGGHISSVQSDRNDIFVRNNTLSICIKCLCISLDVVSFVLQM